MLLESNVKKRIKEHSWIEFENRDKNKSQTWSRVKDHSTNALLDLSLLARKLPWEKKREIFNHKIMSQFFYDLFHGYETRNEPNMELISFLNGRCLQIIISRYSEMNKHSPHLSNLTIEYLKRTQQICNDITRLAISEDLRKYHEMSNEIYLFRVTSEHVIDKYEFTAYVISLIKEMKKGYIVDTDLDFLKFPNKFIHPDQITHLVIKISIIDGSMGIDDGDNRIGNITIKMKPIEKTAELTITIKDEQKNKKLLMSYDEGRGIYNFYLKKGKQNQ